MHVGRVDVGDEPEGERPVGVVAQCLVGHGRAEVGAPDPDVHDGPNALSGVAAPIAGPHAVGEAAHSVEDVMDVGYDVLAVHDQGGVRRQP